MRIFFPLTLTVCMLIVYISGIIPVNGDFLSEAIEFGEMIFEIDENGVKEPVSVLQSGKISAKIQALNKSNENDGIKTAILILALYKKIDETYRIVGCSASASQELIYNVECTLSSSDLTVDDITDGSYKLNAFVWSSTEDIAPLMISKALPNAPNIVTYPGPSGISASDKYSLTVNGTPSFVYKSVSPRSDKNGGNSASFTNFSFEDGPVTIEVTKLAEGTINNAVIRPLNLGITPTINGNKVSFTITEPCKVSVEMDNYYKLEKMFVFADAPEVDIPSPDDPSVLYFAPGVYDIGEYKVTISKKTVYIAGGAYVKGKLSSYWNNHNLTIKGRGIFSGENFPWREGIGNIHTKECDNVTIDGIMCINSPSYNITLNFDSDARTRDSFHIVKNVKIISWHDNTDGFHVQGRSMIDDVFFFGHDDAFDIGQFTTEIRVTNCTTWNLWGGAILISWVGEYGGNALVDNLNVIHWDQTGNTSVITCNHGGRGHLKNFMIQNVRIETMEGGNRKLFGLKVSPNPWSGGVPAVEVGSLDNVYMKNIQVDAHIDKKYNTILGYSDTQMVTNVTLENVVMNGKICMNINDAYISEQKHARTIKYIAKNYADNWSFEELNNAQMPISWISQGNAPDAASIIDEGAYLAFRALKHFKNTNYQVYTYQLAQDLPNGKYKLSAWVRSSGGQTASFMEAKDFGGTAKRINIPQSSVFTNIEISDIAVNNSQCSIGFSSDAGAEQWIVVDNVILERTGN